MKSIFHLPENILAVILICLTLWSCNKSVNNENLVEFKFQLYNEEGEHATTFVSGENFRFCFSIINNAEDRIFLSEMYNMENFFEVFKISDSGEQVSYGKPYDAIFCEYVGGYVINSGETFLVEIPWVPDQDLHIPILCGLKYDNTQLPVGNYQTIVSPTCSFQKGGEDFLTTTSSINISFQINP